MSAPLTNLDRSMPITPFLGGATFDTETKRVMGVAFEMVCAALRVSDRGDLAKEIIAERIIELANAGERNPDLLCEGVLKEFREVGSALPRSVERSE